MSPAIYFKAGVAAVCLLILWKICGMIYGAGQDSIQVKWEVAKLEHANALIKQEAVHRAELKRWAAANTLLLTWLHKDKEMTRDEYEAAIAAANNGTVRLRGDLAGCRDRLSSATSAAPGSDGAGDAGLSLPRQELALRIGRDADLVVAKLKACQAYVRAVQSDAT